MTCNVFGGTLNLAQSINLSTLCVCECLFPHIIFIAYAAAIMTLFILCIFLGRLLYNKSYESWQT